MAKDKMIKRHFNAGVGRKLHNYETTAYGDIVIKNPRGLYRWIRHEEVKQPVHLFECGVFRLLKNEGTDDE